MVKRRLKALGLILCFILGYLALQVGVDAGISGLYRLLLSLRQVDAAEADALYAQFMQGNVALVSLVCNLVFLGLVFALLRLRRAPLRQTLSLFPFPKEHFAVLLLGAFCTAILSTVLLSLAAFSPALLAQYTELVEMAVTGGSPLVSVLSTALVAPCAEEILFRGGVYKTLRASFPLLPALLLESALFALLHGSPVWMLYAFFVGAVLTLLFEAYGSLLPCILFHFCFNAIGGYVVPLLPFDSAAGFLALFAGAFIGMFLCVRFLAAYVREKRRPAPEPE